MARNGSGTQTSPGASFPAVTGTIIDSSKFNNIVNDINSEITKSIANDGQTPITANLPMSGFKHTGAADATATGQYLVYGQSSASLVSPALTGTPTAPTATAGTNTTQIATTAFVAASFAKSGANTDITSLNAPSLGSATATTQTAGDNSTKVATTAYVDAAGVSSKIQPITASVGSNALTLTLNATKLDFRSSTLSSGTVNTRTISSPISVVVSSGSTLGTVNATAARLVIIAIDNAGTVELAVTNLAGGLNLDETTLISTTAEGGAGAADSANVIYSTTARANVPFRVVGFVDITETTAGTWASAPTTIQGAGGGVFGALCGANLAANGYQKLPSGLIIQWGLSGALAQSSSVTVTLPMTFPTSCLWAAGNMKGPYDNAVTEAAISTTIVSTTQISLGKGTNGGGSGTSRAVYWIAIGY